MRRVVLAILLSVALVSPAAAASGRGGPGYPPGLAPITAPRDAAVATTPITVLHSSARSAFPTRLDFNLQAKSDAPITSVRIDYRVGDDPVISVAKVTFSSATQASASYQIDLSQEYYPPGVTIQYRWEIQDGNGAHLVTDWSKLSVVDPRFFWKERSLGVVTLHWYDGDDQFANAVLAAAAKALATASATAGVSTIEPVQIYLYGHQQEFRSAMGANVDQWVGGQTYPLYRLVVLLTPPSDVADAERSVAHEMTHVVVDSTGEDPYGELPTWLDEGMAMVAEGSPDPVSSQALVTAAQAHQLMSIQSLSGNFPESTAGATLAYAESDSLVGYFVQTYGHERLATLIVAFRQGDTSDEAFQQSVCLSTSQFQSRWETSVQRQADATTSSNQQNNHGSLITVLLTPVTFVVAFLESAAQLLQVAKRC